ncbi:hypothetical protein [Pseudonocardia sp. H11422]|uniref:hypothetical protein n=1 Tax=Pseudonocardia sp. H11422 TaxID=2835866 RepID=UPI001BDBDEEE|nr:hypothetical protein [Pseudonocardia sp. H11422]
MGERTFLPEVERSMSATGHGWARQDPTDSGRSAAVIPRPQYDGEDPLVSVARRLQSQLEQHVRLLGQMHADEQRAEFAAGLSDLLDATRRMRRNSESLLMLCGADPGSRGGAPRGLADVLHDAVSVTDDPRRIVVLPAPSVSLAPRAAVELLHLLVEMLDHATAASRPGSRIDVVTRVEVDGGLAVEVLADGSGAPRRHRPHPGSVIADRLAQRSGTAIRLRRPHPGAESGSVAILYCPPAVLSGAEREPALSPLGVGDLPSGVPGLGRRHDAPGPGLGEPTGMRDPIDGRGSAAASSGADELFGPLLDQRREPAEDLMSTPIFEAVASAWFRQEPSDGSGPSEQRVGPGEPVDWDSPSDAEWRAAQARAARPDPAMTTSSGLPRRRPGGQLVAPPLATADPAPPGPGERVPDRVRDRLATYQRGLRQGRHRAADPEPPQPAATEPDPWWSGSGI